MAECPGKKLIKRLGHKKTHRPGGPGGGLDSGNDLLSHGLSPHYHRRCSVSLPGSEWSRVVPLRYDHQTPALGMVSIAREAKEPLRGGRPGTGGQWRHCVWLMEVALGGECQRTGTWLLASGKRGKAARGAWFADSCIGDDGKEGKRERDALLGAPVLGQDSRKRREGRNKPIG